jgi:hydroxysqualene synthase
MPDKQKTFEPFERYEPSDRYENFPVGSWLIPAGKRPIVHAIYRFARFADDVADEGEFSAQERIETLNAIKNALNNTADSSLTISNTKLLVPQIEQVKKIIGDLKNRVFTDSAANYKPYLLALIDAFIQDSTNSAQRPLPPKAMFRDHAELLAYCEKSANPVGRMMLLIFDCHRPELLVYSDAICSGLQWINFMQDVSVDAHKGRIYCPANSFNNRQANNLSHQIAMPSAEVILDQAIQARALLLSGKPLLAAVPLRLSLELRAILAGGLTLADKVIASGGTTQNYRPTLSKRDAGKLIWRFFRLA